MIWIVKFLKKFTTNWIYISTTRNVRKASLQTKTKFEISDDDFTSKPGSSKPSKKIEEKSREVLKEVDPKDFFGQAAKKSKPENTEKGKCEICI